MRNSMLGFNRTCCKATILVAACMLWIGFTNVLHAKPAPVRKTCSDASVAGDWAYTETGTVIPATGATPFAAVANYTIDSKGNLIGTATSSSGGTVSNVTLEGSATVNPDCTGTLTVGVYASGTLVRTVSFDIVYVNNSRAARGIVTSIILANGTSVPVVLTIDAQKVFHP